MKLIYTYRKINKIIELVIIQIINCNINGDNDLLISLYYSDINKSHVHHMIYEYTLVNNKILN